MYISSIFNKSFVVVIKKIAAIRKKTSCPNRFSDSCIHAVDSSSSYIFQEEINVNQRDSGIADMSWPFVGYVNLGGESEESKTHRICLARKRFIIMHC